MSRHQQKIALIRRVWHYYHPLNFFLNSSSLLLYILNSDKIDINIKQHTKIKDLYLFFALLNKHFKIDDYNLDFLFGINGKHIFGNLLNLKNIKENVSYFNDLFEYVEDDKFDENEKKNIKSKIDINFIEKKILKLDNVGNLSSEDNNIKTLLTNKSAEQYFLDYETNKQYELSELMIYYNCDNFAKEKNIEMKKNLEVKNFYLFNTGNIFIPYYYYNYDIHMFNINKIFEKKNKWKNAKDIIKNIEDGIKIIGNEFLQIPNKKEDFLKITSSISKLENNNKIIVWFLLIPFFPKFHHKELFMRFMNYINFFKFNKETDEDLENKKNLFKLLELLNIEYKNLFFLENIKNLFHVNEKNY